MHLAINNSMMSLLGTVAVLLLLPLPYAVDNAPSMRRSPVTLLLVVANLVVFAATHFTAHGMVDPVQLYNDYGLTPSDVHATNLITYTFLHLNVSHVVWNMLVLYLFGTVVEERVGSILFGALYLIGGVAAGLLDAAMVMHFAPNASTAYVPLVGASGAIAGIVGLFAVFASRRALLFFWPLGTLIGRGWHLLEISAGFGVALWVVQNLYGALTTLLGLSDTGIAYFAHLGGFLFGAVFGLIGRLDSAASLRRAILPTPATALDRRAGALPAPAMPAPASATGVVALLERSVAEGDYERAAALYGKCRALGATLTADLLDRLGVLAAENGFADKAAQFRAQALAQPGDAM